MLIKYSAINIDDFDYILNEERIAKYPLKNRDESKLLISRPNQNIQHTSFTEIAGYLPENSFLVLNNTKVIFARLPFKKATGAHIEILCLQPVSPAGYERIFTTRGKCVWKCIVGNLKKWKNEVLEYKNKDIYISAEKIKMEKDDIHIRFTWNKELTFGELINTIGNVPIPPYLNRSSETLDKERYQTVYSLHKGSVAAPTAGFHFTANILKQVESLHIHLLPLTLHIGAGTFQPVKTKNALEHAMHSEHIIISEDLVRRLSEKRIIVATGTTATRTLESLYWLAQRIRSDSDDLKIPQYIYNENYSKLTRPEVCEIIMNYMKKHQVKEIGTETQIMIVPGYSFRMTDVMITNFHQPKSTLLLLIAAFVGDRWKEIYSYALKHEFRFLSYGDSSLLFPSPDALL